MFNSEWSEKQLGELAHDVKYGMNAAAMPFDGITKYIRITDIDEASNRFLPNPVTSPDEPADEKYKLGIGDIVFARTGASVGKSYLYDEKDGNLAFAGFLICFSIKENVANRFFVFLQTKRKEYWEWVKVNSMRSGQPGINAQEFKTFSFHLPALPEQRKIADFLTAVDGRITQLVRKKALLEDYKKGVMQQLFTQALRFKDDHGNDFPEWEEKKLGEMTKWTSGGTPAKDKPAYWNGDIPWMSAASMHERYYYDSPLKITEEGVRRGSKMASKGTLLLLVRGSMLWNRIPVGIATRDVAFNQDVKALLPCKKISAAFLLQWFIASENLLLHKVVGTGIGAGKLDTEEMKCLELRLPSHPEQTKIADFLTALDHKIATVSSQITETQTWKRGLLQQMFV